MRFLLLLLLLTSCCNPHPWPPPYDPDKPEVVTPPPPPPPELPECERACMRLKDLGCKEAEPTPKGETCVEFCNKTQDSDLVSLNPQCVAEMKKCSEIDSCTGSE